MWALDRCLGWGAHGRSISLRSYPAWTALHNILLLWIASDHIHNLQIRVSRPFLLYTGTIPVTILVWDHIHVGKYDRFQCWDLLNKYLHCTMYRYKVCRGCSCPISLRCYQGHIGMHKISNYIHAMQSNPPIQHYSLMYLCLCLFEFLFVFVWIDGSIAGEQSRRFVLVTQQPRS